MGEARSSDAQIRNALVSRLLAAGYVREQIRHEVPLDLASSDGRADLVVIRSDALVGVEIKSGKDTLERLTKQRPRYSARFDRIVIFSDARHSPKHEPWWHGWETCSVTMTTSGAIEFGDNYWSGMGALTGSGIQRGSNHLSAAAMLSMLYTSEIRRIAGDPDATRSSDGPRLAEIMPMREIRAAVSEALRSRAHNRWEDKFWQQFETAHVDA